MALCLKVDILRISKVEIRRLKDTVEVVVLTVNVVEEVLEEVLDLFSDPVDCILVDRVQGVLVCKKIVLSRSRSQAPLSFVVWELRGVDDAV